MLSENDLGIQSLSEHSTATEVPLPFSEGYWIPRVWTK